MFWFDIVLQSTKSTGVRGIEAVSTSSEFTHGAIVHLIEAMQRCWDVYSARERSLLFQSVQKELESHGHSLPVEKIRRKWNNLIVTYKRVKDRSLLCGGQTKTSWEYFEVRDWKHVINNAYSFHKASSMFFIGCRRSLYSHFKKSHYINTLPFLETLNLLPEIPE